MGERWHPPQPSLNRPPSRAQVPSVLDSLVPALGVPCPALKPLAGSGVLGGQASTVLPCLAGRRRLWLNALMTTFSERYGYKPDRTKLHQFGEMDCLLRIAIWNFLLERYFQDSAAIAQALMERVWVEVIRRPSDEFLKLSGLELQDVDHGHASFPLKDSIRKWYFGAHWNEVYDVLQFILRKSQNEEDVKDANRMLSREGSAYRFVAGAIAPITSKEELSEVEAATRLPDPFDGASQHIGQAVALLGNRENPDPRNAMKESISAVEAAVVVAAGTPKASFEKDLQKLGLHSQHAKAWSNMYNWMSDEDGVRHAMKGPPQVGIAVARYVVVACSAFVNYLVSRKSEG